MEIEFALPYGYVDGSGRVHRQGRMRMATVADEISPNSHPLVRDNAAYQLVLLMARVITRLGELPAVTPQIVEGLFASDMAYLEELYLRLNSPAHLTVGTVCPHCHNQLQVQVTPLI